MSQAVLAAQRMEARIASEQMEGIVQAPVVNWGIVQAPVVDENTGYSTSDSELSTVSSSRFSGLDEDWWKEQTSSASRTLENVRAPEPLEPLEPLETLETLEAPELSNSRATVTVMRTRSKDKRVHWE
jgi:hypothetical protein